MRFACDACGTRYNVSDEKVRGKVVKVRCRKCEEAIVVDARFLEEDGSRAPGPSTDEGDGNHGESRSGAAPEDSSPEASTAGAREGAGESAPGEAGPRDDSAAEAPSREDGAEASKDEPADGPDSPKEAAALRGDAASAEASSREDRAEASKDEPADDPDSPKKAAARLDDAASVEAPRREEGAEASKDEPADDPDSPKEAAAPLDDVASAEAPVPIGDAADSSGAAQGLQGGPWRAIIAGKELGPLSAEEMLAQSWAGTLTETSLVWSEELGDWRPAGEVPMLAGFIAAGRLDTDATSLPPVSKKAPPPELASPPPSSDVGSQSTEDSEGLEGLFDEMDGSPSDGTVETFDGDSLFADQSRGDDDDPFARALEEEAAASAGHDPLYSERETTDVDGPPRETTQVFILASGVKEQRSPLRIAAFVAGIAGMLVALGLVVNLTTGLNLTHLVPVGSERREALPWESRGGNTELRDRLLGLTRDEEPESKVQPARGAVRPVETEAERRIREEREAERAALGDEDRELLSDLYQQDDRRTVAVRARRDRDERGPVDASDSPIDPEAVHRRLAETQSAFEACVQQEVRRNPSFRGGRMEMTLTVAPSGVVREARLSDRGLDRSEVGRCLTRGARRMMLPGFAGEDSIDIVVPLFLAASQ